MTECTPVATKFGDWILSNLAERDWTQSQLAKRANIGRQVIYNYINKPRINPDKDILSAIAAAFGMPETEVFRAAGVLRGIPNPVTQYQETLDYSLSQLDDDQLMEVLQFIEFIKQRDKQPVKQTSKPAKQKREGINPPEAVK